jgi:uncharacterized membrane protein
MKSSPHRWLLEHIPEWERDGLLTAEAARTLRERHGAELAAEESHAGGARSRWAQMVTGSMGALLVGFGLIAVIGYNWDDFSRPVRLLFAFLPLLAAQLWSLRILLRGETMATWVRECAGLLQALATGACLAIVSQMYNLGGEWPDLLFWWMLLSLPLVWVLRSKAVAVFYLTAVTVWSVSRMDHVGPWSSSPVMYPVLLIGLLPLWPGWPPQHVPSIFMRWLLTISAIVGLCGAVAFASDVWGPSWGEESQMAVWLWTVIAAVLVLFPLSPSGMAESLGRKPQVVLGALWLLGYGLAGTFRESNERLLEGMVQDLSWPWAWGLLAVMAAFMVMAALRERWAVLAMAAIGLLPVIAYPLAGMLNWVSTVYLFGLGVLFIVLEFTGRRGSPRLGAAVLCALIIARMVDSQFSLLTKGLVFMVAGVAFLVFNLAMTRPGRGHALKKP